MWNTAGNLLGLEQARKIVFVDGFSGISRAQISHLTLQGNDLDL